MKMTTVLVKGDMNASAEKVWNTLKGFDLNYLRGFAHTVEGSGVGATRKFDAGGGETAEQVEKYDPANKTLTYTILYGTLPVQIYHATIKVIDGDENSCGLEWSAVFEPKGAAEEAIAAVEGLFKYNIKSLNKFYTV
jgi:hypothetical protein